MDFIKTADGREGVEAMAQKITASLGENERVLWLICGGSNIPLAARAMEIIRKSVGIEQLQNFTIGQTDERFGPIGHPDSNWQQMHEAKFDFSNIQAMPILMGENLEVTVQNYKRRLEEALGEADFIVAQFGIGADGHIAGMLPHTGGVDEKGFAFGYEAVPFTRITMTPPAFAHIDAAYTFAFGEAKREAIHNLQTKELPLAQEPCQILKMIPESYFYSEQVE